jgi:hypothetical protein
MDATNGNTLRAYQKTSSIWNGPGGSGNNPLFATDYLGSGSTVGGVTVSAFNPSTFAHYPGQGFNCIFKDGSVRFVQSVDAFNFVSSGQLITDETTASRIQYNQIFNELENGD